MGQEQGNAEQQMNPIQAVAQNLEMQERMHTGLAMQVQGFDAETLKHGLVELLNGRAELLQSLRNALVTEQDQGMLVIAQLAASGALSQIGAMSEIISAARAVTAMSKPEERRIIS